MLVRIVVHKTLGGEPKIKNEPLGSCRRISNRYFLATDTWSFQYSLFQLPKHQFVRWYAKMWHQFCKENTLGMCLRDLRAFNYLEKDLSLAQLCYSVLKALVYLPLAPRYQLFQLVYQNGNQQYQVASCHHSKLI